MCYRSHLGDLWLTFWAVPLLNKTIHVVSYKFRHSVRMVEDPKTPPPPLNQSVNGALSIHLISFQILCIFYFFYETLSQCHITLMIKLKGKNPYIRSFMICDGQWFLFNELRVFYHWTLAIRHRNPMWRHINPV